MDMRYVFSLFDHFSWRRVMGAAVVRTRTSAFAANAAHVRSITATSMQLAIEFAESARRARMQGITLPVPASVDRAALKLVNDAKLVDSARPWSSERRVQMRNNMIAMRTLACRVCVVCVRCDADDDVRASAPIRIATRVLHAQLCRRRIAAAHVDVWH
jgi:hypothetical protein